MRLAALTKKEDGEIFNQDATLTTGYDVDWATGTVWTGVYKLASATHRKDANRMEDFHVYQNGRVDIRAITAVTGCEWGQALEAFQQKK